MKYAFIRDHRVAFPVDLMCRSLEVYSGPLSQDNKPLSLSYTLDIICNWTALPRFCLFFE